MGNFISGQGVYADVVAATDIVLIALAIWHSSIPTKYAKLIS